MSELERKLLQGFVDSQPITQEEAAELVRISETAESYSKLSKALCGKKNATLGELLQVIDQVNEERNKGRQMSMEEMGK